MLACFPRVTLAAELRRHRRWSQTETGGTGYLAVVIILAIDKGCLNQGGDRGSCETWSESGNILEGEPMGFTNGQDLWCKGEESTKNTKSLS